MLRPLLHSTVKRIEHVAIFELTNGLTSATRILLKSIMIGPSDGYTKVSMVVPVAISQYLFLCTSYKMTEQYCVGFLNMEAVCRNN